MKQVLLCALVTISIISTSYGQKQRVYLDSNLRITTADDAIFYEDWKEKGGLLVGPFREYYISGKLKKECNYRNEVLDGVYISYFENGQLEVKGTYVNGRKDGEWNEWYENGQPKQKETYLLVSTEAYGGVQVTRGRNDGLFEEWHENGKYKTKGLYAKGDKKGVWEAWHDNNQLAEKGNYKAGNREGIWEVWYKNKQLKSKGNYKEGGKVGIWEEWHENGNLAKKGSYTALEKQTQRDSPFSKGLTLVLKTRKSGIWESWYESKQLAKRLNYKEGDLVGSAELWYSNGTKAEEYDFDKGIFVNGWDQDGTQLVTAGEGTMKHYNAEDRLISMGSYKKGLRVGDWTFYTKDGKSSTKKADGKIKKLTRIDKGWNTVSGLTFGIVEESASPVGGMKSFYTYIRNNLKYPKAARKLKLQGKAFLSFIIDREGRVTHTQIIRSAGFSIDREALRILRESPNWNPGKQRGKPVRQKMTFPINFKL